MVVGRGGELNARLVGTVVDDNIRLFRLDIVTGVDSDASTILVESLGGLNRLDVEIVAGRSSEADREVIVCVGGINVNVSMVSSLCIDFRASRDSVKREESTSVRVSFVSRKQ